MPRYWDLDSLDASTQRRCVEHLLSLRNYLRDKTSKGKLESEVRGVPRKNLDHSLLVATWNIREFGNNKKFGPRLPESLFYIAEVIAAFDVIALQEVNEDLTDFWNLMSILGDDWGYLLTDITLGRRGNGERTAFVYDKRKVVFEGLASQVVIPEDGPKYEGIKLNPRRQLARTPMMVGFRSGWFKFSICTAHIYYGKDTAEEPTRLKEIALLAKHLAARATGKFAWAPTMLLLGDFNIFKPEDKTFKAITEAGFYVPEPLLKFKAGDAGKHYDQIAILSERYDKNNRARGRTARAGTLRLFDKVFRDDEAELYKKHTSEKKYRQWRTFQISDHRPMWIELQSDFATAHLAKLFHQLKASAPAEVVREELTDSDGDS